MSTDRDWEDWGARDPYYGVLTHPRFRTATLTPEAREEFFHSGRVHAEHVINTVRTHIDPAFAPQRILDFGCGVGRVLIPFAHMAGEAVGMDISPSMLAEAGRNAEAQGVNNLRLLLSDDKLSALQGDFDLVHSCIVLQHVEIPRGRELFRQLVQRIRPGGMGALQVTFAWDYHDTTFGQPPLAPSPAAQGSLDRLKTRLRGLFSPAAQPPEFAIRKDPEMQMNFYNLSELLYLMQKAGARSLHTDVTNHDGALGVFMFFRREVSAAGSHS